MSSSVGLCCLFSLFKFWVIFTLRLVYHSITRFTNLVADGMETGGQLVEWRCAPLWSVDWSCKFVVGHVE